MSRNNKTGVETVVALTELDCDISLELVLEANGVNAGDGFDDGRFTVSDMSNGADVDRGLPRYHLR